MNGVLKYGNLVKNYLILLNRMQILSRIQFHNINYFNNFFERRLFNDYGIIGNLMSPLREIMSEEGIVRVSTFRRKRTKLKKSKRRQRRKKLRGLSPKKRHHRNY